MIIVIAAVSVACLLVISRSIICSIIDFCDGKLCRSRQTDERRPQCPVGQEERCDRRSLRKGAQAPLDNRARCLQCPNQAASRRSASRQSVRLWSQGIIDGQARYPNFPLRVMSATFIKYVFKIY